jgi:hypothetical protein
VSVDWSCTPRSCFAPNVPQLAVVRSGKLKRKPFNSNVAGYLLSIATFGFSYPRVSSNTPSFAAFTAVAPSVRFNALAIFLTPIFKETIDSGLEIDEGAEDAALEAAPCELGEEAFHGFEPGRRGWDEVERPAGMSRKPSARYYGANATRGP